MTRVFSSFCFALSFFPFLVFGQACPFSESAFALGGTFSGSCTLDVGGSVTITGTVVWAGGTLTIDNTAGGAAILLINGPDGSLTINGGTVGLTDAGRFEINSGGTLTVGSSGALVTTSTGNNFVFDGGHFQSNGNSTLGGDLRIDGGDATIAGGSFSISRSGGDGDIELSSDGTLTVTGGNISIQDDIVLTAGSTGSIAVNAGATLNTGDDVQILGGTMIVDGTLSAGDRINFGAGSGGSLVGTTVGGVLQFGGGYTPDADCPYSQGSIDFCSCLVSGCMSVLPIVLSEFDAKQEGGAVRLHWITQSEINNDYFEVERLNLADDSFDRVGYVPGNGTSNEIHHYTFLDFSPTKGKNYYRLKQTDFDGKFSFSNLEMIDVDGITNEVTVHPNPATGGQIIIEGRQSVTTEPMLIEVKNLLGLVLLSCYVMPDPSGVFSLNLDTNNLKPGCFLVTIGPLSTRLFIR